MSQTFSRPELVIFDCDGVLVDSEPPTLALLREDFVEHGFTVAMSEIEARYVGQSMANVAKLAMAEGARLPEDWIDRFYAKMFDRLRAGVPLIEGLEETLDALDAARIPYCVGSNGPMAKMEITLGAHPQVFTRLKGRIFSAHDHGTAKPDPGLFLIAADFMGIAPEHCIVVDDSRAGCIAARRAGMRCFGFDTAGDGAHLEAEGAQALSFMGDLPTRIGL